MPEAMLRAYPAAHSRYDEMLAAPLQARPHWHALMKHLASIAPGEMRQREQKVQRQVRENGVTYNVYADPLGTDRPWDLDMVPMIIPAHEWAQIEAGVVQRARLLNQILLDVYGPQTLLENGHLPASLIHGHSGFLRPCHGVYHPGGVALHHYAVDLARSPDGRWWAVSDRTQAPAGAGYALENRMVISRAFPELFRDLKIQRLAAYFSAMRDALRYWGQSCAPYPGHAASDQGAPLIVLLTPGPYNETYYEQAYLARYLGFALVQGKDLTVRDGFVWLKTLKGLQRVHVIVRRVDDDFCDPLELRPESALGVAGLTEAARRGTVLITNSLGSNLLESGALLGFLPKLSKLLLGESLKIPSVGTWWCGEPAALEDAISHMQELVFKPAFPQLRQTPVFGVDLDAQERAAFIAKLEAQPQNFVAQEMVKLAQVPVWQGGQLGASAAGIRVFACATPNGYVVMPGGLTRVATGPDARVIAMQRGGTSKDTWVLSDTEVNSLSLLHQPTSSNELVRGDTHLASRIVENLYWFGRYAERCDNTARLIRCSFETLMETPSRGSTPTHTEWPILLALCEDHALLGTHDEASEGDSELGSSKAMSDPAEIERQLLRSMYDATRPGLAHHIQQLFRAGFSLRERLSTDNWRALNQMLQRLGKPDPALSIADAMSLLDEAAISQMTLAGFTLDGMTRDIGWRFLSMGRRIERLQFMCSVIQHALSMPSQGELDWLLELGDSIITYRSRYMARPEWLPTLDLLLLDESNPRSVVFQLDGLVHYLQKVAAQHGPCGSEMLEPLLTQLRALDPARDLHPGSETLLSLMRNLHSSTYRLSEQLAARFFSYSGRLDQGLAKVSA